jgi:hypothetical protein
MARLIQRKDSRLTDQESYCVLDRLGDWEITEDIFGHDLIDLICDRLDIEVDTDTLYNDFSLLELIEEVANHPEAKPQTLWDMLSLVRKYLRF